VFVHAIGRQRGQASPEWLGLLLVVTLLAIAVGGGLSSRLGGAALARAIGARIICAIRLSDSCGRDPDLVAAYGEELAGLLRRHAPQVAYESGMKALPVDYRRCRSPVCSNATQTGIVSSSADGMPVSAFVHVIDCRAGQAEPFAGVNAPVRCTGERRGNLYLQYWLYYPDSATLRGIPVGGQKGFHLDDWESYQVRIEPDGLVSARASSHHGYNYEQSALNGASDAGWGPIRDALESVGLRARGGWGPETGWLFVSGGSHAGNAKAKLIRHPRVTLGRRLRLLPLDPVAVGEEASPAFAVTPPWRKRVWRDPEEEGTE
jgi:hypothetical protein